LRIGNKKVLEKKGWLSRASLSLVDQFFSLQNGFQEFFIVVRVEDFVRQVNKLSL
jgi:hypothetical protein